MNKRLIVFTLLLLCSFQSFCFSWSQLLGYVWVCKNIEMADDQSMILTGGFLDHEHGCRTCKVCYKRYSRNALWKIIWQEALEQETLICQCSVDGYIHDYTAATKESSLLLHSCPNEKEQYNDVKRIENCNGILTCGDCSEQIKNP